MPDSRVSPRLESPRDVVFRDIIRGLYEGRFAPGQRLVEGDLTALYGVSRGPVREALSRLAAEGIVELRPQRGAVVRRLSRAEAIDIMRVVGSLMGLAARLAVGRIDAPGMAARLQTLLAELESFDPSNPAADAKGYVKLPNVNSFVEVMDMQEAERSYSANLNAMEASRSMLTRTVGMLK